MIKYNGPIRSLKWGGLEFIPEKKELKNWIYKTKRLTIILYRKLYDFPFNWKPYGWEKNQMTDFYWSGYTQKYTIEETK